MIPTAGITIVYSSPIFIGATVCNQLTRFTGGGDAWLIIGAWRVKSIKQ